MSVKQDIYQALRAILPNTHAVELPKNPKWPAILFSVDTDPETGWCQNGGYDRHDIQVAILSTSMAQIEELKPLIEPAMATITGYLWANEHGDGDFESLPDVYVYAFSFEARTRQGA